MRVVGRGHNDCVNLAFHLVEHLAEVDPPHCDLGGLNVHQTDLFPGQVTVDDVAQFLCIFDNGATGSFEATRLATGRKNNNTIEINGEKGSLKWDFEDQNYLEFYDKLLILIN